MTSTNPNFITVLPIDLKLRTDKLNPYTANYCYTRPRYSESLVIPNKPEASGFLTIKLALAIPHGHTIPNLTACKGLLIPASIHLSLVITNRANLVQAIWYSPSVHQTVSTEIVAFPILLLLTPTGTHLYACQSY